MSERPTVGFIGVGLMGHGMAMNILKGGYPLIIKGNRNRVPVDDLVSRGATEAPTAREMAERCDIIHLCLSNSPQVEAIIRGHDGILAGARAGLIVVDTTTADPTSTVRLAEEMAAQGVHMADAPLGRTPKEAEAGTLDAMVGASDEVFGRIKPVLDCWSGSVTHLGPVGAGHKMKLIMNFMAMSYASVYAESLSLAVKSGLSPQSVRQVMGPSRMGCGFFETFFAAALGDDPNAHRFAISNAAKDVRYVANMAMAAGVMNPVGAAVRNYFEQAEATGKGAEFVPTLASHVAALNGIDFADAVQNGTQNSAVQRVSAAPDAESTSKTR
ncbi:NAD(P)-dependent oxidoreductase [Palleronia caenipelagi]|uniref:NAD(P)-dependent oxidoreductase n=1 Tax=Palleronia caenipelagi TaxID=2489174 RepID=A0A547PM33_9RHOB|nr:NAD(P)-dependent oxidoreductase [Palleronia caenipelagi]TRD15208.1 NAD(P)-dependent oxidoreductase [Palleronia caenipelagi]